MPGLSRRLLPAVRAPHLTHSASLRANPYTFTNQNRPIDLSVAENVLSLAEFCKALETHDEGDILPALATHLSRGYDIPTTDLAITAGATGSADALAHVLCRRGDTVLLPAPGYAALERDVSTRSGAVVQRYACDDTEGIVKAVEDAFVDRTRMVVVINPTNPTGEVMSASTVRAMAEWAFRRSVHVVFDEAYAWSVCKGRFDGVFEVMQGRLGGFVHVMYTLSKDFGVSGARIGVVHSQNAEIVTAIRGVAEVAGVCGYTMRRIGGLLTDRVWTSRHLEMSCARLREAYEIVATTLTELCLPFREAVAGVFVWADLGELEGDMAGWEQLFECGVLVTPGEDCWGRHEWCRICFATVEMDVLRVAMERLRRAVMEIRRRRG